ncbi:AGE family epimerase/isomerase [Pedobacter sp. Leaf170]|uniref:AGE family epimerase/isomerase n=1 Tax=Pedobacter sp. Leaf170 TaxID=2876558 RepID=UPI001E52D18F|nr:AGE family epimerase/isomerase [Pedobacter sp. Leaf170]
MPATSLPSVSEIEFELQAILHYWKQRSIDNEYGGFVGQIDESEQVISSADKGSVLNARILWSFSAAYLRTGSKEDLAVAERSYLYIKNHFIDYSFGGVYWTVDLKGDAKDKKKQIYAIAFTIYGLAAYFKASCDENALTLAKSLYADIEKYSYDKNELGYFEAFARDWTQLDDLRLSDKDANEKKTMNTHLHILEAYNLLYTLWPDEGLKHQIIKLLEVFRRHILKPDGHLGLFFNEYWEPKSSAISYGHDIEASWLLLEAAEAIKEVELITEFKKLALEISTAAIEGIDKDAMVYEFNPENDHLIAEKHWWVQAEALVGLYNAFQISKDERFLQHFNKIWNYTTTQIIDKTNGEWFWGRKEDGSLMAGEDKAGLWKCPYHNSRACLELLNRFQTIA